MDEPHEPRRGAQHYQPTLRHLPFFEALAAFDSNDPNSGTIIQNELQAAVVVLRLLPDAVECPAIVAGVAEGHVRLKHMIAEIENRQAKYLLGTMLSTIVHWNAADPAVLVGPFLAYAWLLEDRDLHV